MNSNFCIERLWVPPGESDGTVEEGSYFLSMSESGATHVEWSADSLRKRTRERVFSGDTWVWPQGQTWWTRLGSGKTCVQLLTMPDPRERGPI